MIVLAGGKGLRFGSDIPKQFLPIGGKPILMRSIEKIKSADRNINIVLALPKEYKAYWSLLCREYNFDIEHKIVDGGKERFYSVKNALDSIEENEGVVGVHDGVRPFVSEKVIEDAFCLAEQGKNVIPTIKPYETVRLSHKDNINQTSTIDRNLVWLIQTPQCFNINILKKAYNQPYQDFFTDDASLVENLGYEITLIQGNRENIKITENIDCIYAEAILKWN